MCAPLLAGGRTIGVLSLYRPKAQGPFSEVDLNFLVALARGKRTSEVRVDPAAGEIRFAAPGRSKQVSFREIDRLRFLRTARRLDAMLVAADEAEGVLGIHAFPAGEGMLLVGCRTGKFLAGLIGRPFTGQDAPPAPPPRRLERNS